MPHPDLDRLFNSLLPFAERMLADQGEFSPFGGSMKPDGEIVAAAAFDGSEHPPSQDAIDLMTQAFRRQARSGELRAAAICYDGRTTPPGQTEKCDAVCASMEHLSGETVNLVLPYQKTSEGGIQYGQMFTTARIPQMFVRSETAVGGWLLVLCFMLTFFYPATTLYQIFSGIVPGLINPHLPIRLVILLVVYSVLFLPLSIFSFLAGAKLWLVKPGALGFAKRYLLVFLGVNTGYFFLWILWVFVGQPVQISAWASMGWGHVLGPMLAVALWYSYLQRSKRVRTTYL
jgi:hypothetical protein